MCSLITEGPYSGLLLVGGTSNTTEIFWLDTKESEIVSNLVKIRIGQLCLSWVIAVQCVSAAQGSQAG